MISLFERAEAWLFGLALGGYVYFTHLHWKIESSAYGNLMSAGVNFSAIAIGFLASVLSIMIVIADHPVVKYILEIDQEDKHILGYLASVIRWALVLLVVSGVGFLASPLNWFVLWCVAAAGTVAAFERASRTIVALVRRSIYKTKRKE